MKDVIAKMADVQRRMRILILRISLGILVVVSGCTNSPVVHPITCADMEACYDSAASKCRGHWTQVSLPGASFPYADYKDGTYTLNVRCTRPSE
jgi:hypothetical protein